MHARQTLPAAVITAPAARAPRTSFLPWNRWSIKTRLSAAASACAVASLVITCAVIGVRASDMAERDAAELARRAARSVAQQVEGELNTTYTVIEALAQAQKDAKEHGPALSREQIDNMSRATLEAKPSWLGTYSTWEPNALDGRDAEYANAPAHDATGRYIAYWTRGSGTIAAEPGGDTETAGINDWYDIPRRTKKNALIEPYLYKVGGKDELLTSLVTPILVNGKFVGVVGADYLLKGLSERLGKMPSVPDGRISLVSNGGLYVSHTDLPRIGKKAEDMPADAMQAVQQGRDHEWIDSTGWVHVLVPVRASADVPAWSLQVSYPLATARAGARALLATTAAIAAVCALITGVLLVGLIARMLRPLSRLTAAVEDLASGNSNLRVELPVRGHDELARISRAFNAFVAKLRVAFGEVHDAAGGVELAAREIASGNADLSHRTEEQAANLQSVASSMDELTAAVRANADTANEATRLTSGAAVCAQRSEQVMGQAVASMEGLSAASRRIADITAVIDSIAFQTNILALNAAVEAARAGEQGRGFAVVASEVRTLAQRSATAAKDIKHLIDDSVQRVGEGSQLIRDTGSSVAELVQAVNNVSTLIRDISLSGQEQSAGIAQVDSSVADIDRMTQQNAALVEEAAAAADALRQQAQRLTATVGGFL
ncbi:methyl-accepting chemotaxis protein [Eleftheria terrae]|uniref:methyl-accepting chemotaxis protein n=1 Tax=Eleftheria terrae TaxID=1597781 RepID=UPI00263B7653|nr:methyl-accepting chemotaxis protein [Eleftheria terrae]WKB51341.1 methyl-accepting chemotaxis protein [Eleftheria terrae]